MSRQNQSRKLPQLLRPSTDVLLVLPRMATVRGKDLVLTGKIWKNEYLFSISLPRFFKYSFTQLFLAISHDLFRNFVNLFMFSRSFCDFVSCSVARDRKTLNQELHLCQQKIKMSNPYTSWLPRISMLNFQNYVFMIFWRKLKRINWYIFLIHALNDKFSSLSIKVQ